jgi:hypothetical protein
MGISSTYVRCHARISDQEPSHRYVEISPEIFSVGDIVETRVSFLAAPVSGYNGRIFRLAIVLRSIALIDSTFTKVSTVFMVSRSTIPHWITI